MGIYDFSSIEMNFDSAIKELEKLKEVTSKKFKNLEETTNLTKIKQLKKLHIDGFKVRLSTKRLGWNDIPVIRVEWNGYETDDYISKNRLAKGISFEDRWHYVYIELSEGKTEKLDNLIQFIQNTAESEKEAHDKNVTIAKKNLETQNKVFDLLSQIGISTTYYGYKTSRSRDTTKMNYNFPSEISKQIPTNYSENHLNNTRDNLIKQIKDVWNREIQKLREERIKKEKAAKEKEENKKLALLLAKYDLELTDSWGDLLDKVIEQNKYLYLDHYLEENRNDWTNGFDYAERGLNFFKVEDKIDQDIEDNIRSFMYEDWEGDGRVFRDCEYNYSVLYGIASEQNPQLYKDYEVIKSNIEDIY